MLGTCTVVGKYRQYLCSSSGVGIRIVVSSEPLYWLFGPFHTRLMSETFSCSLGGTIALRGAYRGTILSSLNCGVSDLAGFHTAVSVSHSWNCSGRGTST